MPFVLIDDLRMYYAEYGNPQGAPLVLLHGFTGTGDFWVHQLPTFGAHYRLIVPDLRSHGQTDNPGGRPAMNHRQFARDIIGLCRELQITRAAFCGESTGAMLLLSLALYRPTLPAALILAGGTHYFGEECIAMQKQTSPEAIDQGWRAHLQAVHTALGPDHWRQVITAFHDLHAHTREEDFPDADELREITAPVLIVHGDRDRFFPVEMPRQLYRLLPHAEFCVLPNTGHTPPEEYPDWFNDIALDFLIRHYRGSTQSD
jgi:pimeloyl-ACP methyl ester carboxylesterase